MSDPYDWQKSFSKSRLFPRHLLCRFSGRFRLATRENLKAGARVYHITPDRLGKFSNGNVEPVILDSEPMRMSNWSRMCIYGTYAEDSIWRNRPFVLDLEAFERDDTSSGILLIRE
jgi:hypothetical protein